MIGDIDYYIEWSYVLGVCLYFPFHLFLFAFITFHVVSIMNQDYLLFKLDFHLHTKSISINNYIRS